MDDYLKLRVHQIQNFAIRPDPDPCRIRLDLDPNLDYCQQEEKNYSFLHHYWKSWNDCLPYFVTELLLER